MDVLTCGSDRDYPDMAGGARSKTARFGISNNLKAFSCAVLLAFSVVLRS